MKISIIVPVYNVEKYIDKCLNSLVNQTLKDIEILVINDGSPDNSQSIIDDYVKKYPKIVKSFIKENGGQGSARNYGLKHAKGEYIAYVDSDDYVNLDTFEQMYKNAKEFDSDIVICGNNVVSLDNKILSVENSIIYNDKDLDILFGHMAVWNKIYKREILINAGCEFRSKVWYEDIDFSVKLLLDNYKITFINEAFYNYLLRPGSTMNNDNVSRNLEITLAFDEMNKYFKEKNIYGDVYEKLEFLAIYHIFIATNVRVITSKVDKTIKKSVLDKLNNYMDENYSTFKRNKYIRYLSKNKKLIYNLMKNKHYGMIKFIFKLKRMGEK